LKYKNEEYVPSLTLIYRWKRR